MQALGGGSGLMESVAAKSFVVLALVIVVVTLWPRSTASARHLAWTTTFLFLLCLPVFVRCLPAWHSPAWMGSLNWNNRLPDVVWFNSEKLTQPEMEPSPVVSNQLPAPSHSAANSGIISMKPAGGWGGVFVVIWLAGLLLGGVRWLVVQIRLRQLGRQLRPCTDAAWLKLVGDLRSDYQIKQPVKLLFAQTAITPITWGCWKPVVILPPESRQWSPERLQVVLCHELAHVKRRDCLTQEMAQLVCSLYWFNPLVWRAAAWMRAEREKACDDFVLNAGALPAEYAGHLVEIARQFMGTPNVSGVVAMARPSGLEQRIRAILDGHRNRGRIASVTLIFIVAAIFGFELVIGSYAAESSPAAWSLKNSKASDQLKRFVAEKEAQEHALIAIDEKQYAKEGYKFTLPDTRPFFSAAAQGDWPAVSNLWSKIHSGFIDATETNPYPHGLWMQPLIETYGAIEAFASGDETSSKTFGDEVIKSIPPGGIYFGGTDPGRFIVTALQKSHVGGEPFFTLTQNALADGTYLKYLRSMYGDKIYIPTDQDSQDSFQAYLAEAQVRLRENRLKPGEHITESNGRISVGGQVAVMEINALIVKIIFDRNTNHECFIEESFPLDWMYPNLEPHGLIFKLNRQPLSELSDAMVQQDRGYWQKLVSGKIGGWLNDDTSVPDIAAFAEKVFIRHDLAGFSGDPRFVQNGYSSRTFAKLRSSIAGLYVWRMNHAGTDSEKARMAREADFAFRQALALCPSLPEAVKGYAGFLKSQHRSADAGLVEAMIKVPAI